MNRLLSYAAVGWVAVSAATGYAAPKTDWIEIDRGTDYRGVEYVVSIDRASRKKVAEGISVLQHQVLTKTGEDGAIDIVTEYIVDCAMPQKQMMRKYRTDAAGKVLSEEASDRLSGGWRYAARPGDKPLIDAVCR